MGMPVRGAAADVEHSLTAPDAAHCPASPREEAQSAPVGVRLAAERAARNLTLEDVFRGTKIKIAHLTAIEAGDQAALPAVPFTAGFIKAYAQFLGLDANSLAAAYRAEAAPSPPVVAAISANSAGAPMPAPAAAISITLRLPAPVIPTRGLALPRLSQKSASYLGVAASVLVILVIGANTLQPRQAREAMPAAPAATESTDLSIKPAAVASIVSGPAEEFAQSSAPLTSDVPAPTPMVEPEPSEPSPAALVTPRQKPARRSEQRINEVRTDVMPAPAAAPAPIPEPAQSDVTAVDVAAAEPVVQKASLIRAATPRYPDRCAASAAPVETVMVLVDVLADGKPANPRIGDASDPCFSKAALDAAVRMRFSPRIVDGKPQIEFSKQVTVRFQR